MSKTKITWLSPTIGVLRIHVDANKIPGEWSWSCTVELLGDGVAKIHAAYRVFTREELKELKDCAREHGVTRVLWDRYKSNGQIKTVIMNLLD